MNSIQLELQPIQKGQHVFLFFEIFSIETQEIQKTQSMICGHCSEKTWAMDLKIGAVLKKNGIAYLKVVSKHFMSFSSLPVYVLLCLDDLPKIVERNIAEQTKVEQTKAEQSQTGQNQIVQAQTEQSQIKQSQIKQSQIKQSQTEQDQTNTGVYNSQTHIFDYTKDSYSLAIITLSDKGFVGKRIDESAPAISKLIAEKMIFSEERYFILPDDAIALKGLIASLAYNQGFDCIVTTGGTGLSERDITPNALLPMLDQRLHGFEHAMMQASLEKTPTAMLSRAFCGIINKSIIISVPGSVKASTENIEAILPALPHALAKLQGDMSDCGRK